MTEKGVPMATEVNASPEAGPSRDVRPVGIQLGRKPPVVVTLPRRARLRVSQAMFWRICCENPELRFERTARGGLVVMTPAGFRSSNRNLKISTRLENWAEADGTGVASDSSVGYILPDGATRGPDASWISQARLSLVPPAELDRFPHACPDFVVELRSPSDRLASLRKKMRQYIDQGVQLGWLIDPILGKVEIYRPGREPEVLDRPASLSGEGVLPGFVLVLRGILGE